GHPLPERLEIAANASPPAATNQVEEITSRKQHLITKISFEDRRAPGGPRMLEQSVLGIPCEPRGLEARHGRCPVPEGADRCNRKPCNSSASHTIERIEEGLLVGGRAGWERPGKTLDGRDSGLASRERRGLTEDR